ncbi:haloacid dehalogenase-like hydrolase [Ruminococcus sp.]|uniref:haloacid dehalogenase-like hydrolase n=1 Tax=Ruminococcus sp. TaxID=41978 RepID=UPI002BDA79EE|nr:haloacid dehalogenase-like hydrolase [Ruminococcus sp.]HNZ99808.1 haloacid dehalogenase-like hydrolase [Ruminococcus sp.]HOH87799.1 haloacid dehalogenase-like hydrolase [Ruminococcus sp.]
MKVFDFDNTLYNGESAVDLALFMIKRNKRIILWLPRIFWNLLKYKLCLVNRDSMEQTINEFLRVILRDKEELFEQTRQFWRTHSRKLNRNVISRISPDDIIISAGPDFLLRAIKKKLGTSHLLCSEIDYDSKKVIRLNFGENKVKHFRELYGDTAIDSFYTDSYNDRAMMDISDKVFLVSSGRIKRIK